MIQAKKIIKVKISKFEDISEENSGNKNRKIKFNDDKEDNDK